MTKVVRKKARVRLKKTVLGWGVTTSRGRLHDVSLTKFMALARMYRGDVLVRVEIRRDVTP